MQKLRILCFVFLQLSLSSIPTLPQITTLSSSTATPTPGAGHDYIKLLNETVEPASGAVSLRIGLPLPPGRATSIPFNISYDGGSAHFAEGFSAGSIGWTYNNSLFAKGGWSYSAPLLTFTSKSFDYPPGDPEVESTCAGYYGYLFQDPSGQRHSLDVAHIINDLPQNGLACSAGGIEEADAGGRCLHKSVSKYRVHNLPLTSHFGRCGWDNF